MSHTNLKSSHIWFVWWWSMFCGELIYSQVFYQEWRPGDLGCILNRILYWEHKLLVACQRNLVLN